jgi:hypothetical protein
VALTASESFTITQHRQHLQEKIDQFHKGLAIMGTNLPEVSARYTSTTKHADDLDQLDLDEGDDEGAWLAADDEEIGEEEPEITPENIPLYLPSAFTAIQRKSLAWQELGNMELQLREGQANDLLERLRECLAEKSLRFRTEVRPANGQKKSTRAWGSIHRMDNQIKETVVIKRCTTHGSWEKCNLEKRCTTHDPWEPCTPWPMGCTTLYNSWVMGKL